MADNGLLDNNFSRIDLDLDARLGSILSKHEHLISRISSSLQKEATAMGEPSFSYRQNGGQDSIKHAFVVPQGMADKAQRIIQAQITQILDNAISNLPEGSVNMSASPTSVKHFNTPINDRQLKASISSLVKYTKGNYSQLNGNSIFSIPTDLQMGDAGSYADIWQHQIAAETENFGGLSTTESLMSRAVMESMKSRRQRQRLRLGYGNSMMMGGQGFNSGSSFFGGSNRLEGSNPLSTHVRGFREQMRFAGSSSTLWGSDGGDPPPPDDPGAPGESVEKTNLLGQLGNVGTILKGIQVLVSKILHFMQNPMTVARGASGRMLGLSNNDLSIFDYAETLRGASPGTVKSAIGGFNEQFGDITNLNQRAITSLALLGSGESEEALKSAILSGIDKSSSPKEAFFKTYDTILESLRGAGGNFADTNMYKFAESIDPNLAFMVAQQLERESHYAPGSSLFTNGMGFWMPQYAQGASLTEGESKEWQSLDKELGVLKSLFQEIAQEIKQSLLPAFKSWVIGLQNGIHTIAFWRSPEDKQRDRQLFYQGNLEDLERLRAYSLEASTESFSAFGSLSSSSATRTAINNQKGMKSYLALEALLGSKNVGEFSAGIYNQRRLNNDKIDTDDILALLLDQFLVTKTDKNRGIFDKNGGLVDGKDKDFAFYLLNQLDGYVRTEGSLESGGVFDNILRLKDSFGTNISDYAFDQIMNVLKAEDIIKKIEDVQESESGEAKLRIDGTTPTEDSKGFDNLLERLSAMSIKESGVYSASVKGASGINQGATVYLTLPGQNPVKMIDNGAYVLSTADINNLNTPYQIT